MNLVDDRVTEMPAGGKLVESSAEVDGLEALGRNPDEEVLPISEGFQDLVLVRSIHLAIDSPDAVDSKLVRVELLILDERDNGAHNEADTGLQQTGHLVAEGFTGARRQNPQRRAPGQRLLDYAVLPRPELVVVEDVFEEELKRILNLVLPVEVEGGVDSLPVL